MKLYRISWRGLGFKLPASVMFSQTVEYALRCAAALARNRGEGLLTGRDIADRTQVPGPYVTKVMSYLIRADLVTGARGVGGGYALARPANAISMLDVVNAIEPLRRITACPLNIPSHGSALCTLHHRLDDAIARVAETLRSCTLAELADSIEPPSADHPCPPDRPPTVGVTVQRSNHRR